MNFPRAFTSVTRWLLVVIGCAVLATAQPMSSDPAPAAAPQAPEAGKRSGETVIYPKNAPEPAKTATRDEYDSSRSLLIVVALLLAAGGAWLVFQRRKAGPATGRGRKLQIDETKPLGNRQYLVVADYDGKKFLLGVTPGRIQMLAPLDGSGTPKIDDEDEE